MDSLVSLKDHGVRLDEEDGYGMTALHIGKKIIIFYTF